MRQGRGWVTLAGVFAAACVFSCRQSEPPAPAPPASAPAATTAAAPGSSPSSAPDQFSWAAAIARVEEVRGSAGRISTPSELLHYDDRRRFLAVQMADA